MRGIGNWMAPGIAIVVAGGLFMGAAGHPGIDHRIISKSERLASSEPAAQESATPVRLELRGFFPGPEMEKDDIYLSNALSLAKDDTGDILVLDFKAKTVFEFAPDGRFIRRFGRAGQGPGEFSSPIRVVCSGTSRYVKDSRRIHVFDRTGQYERSLTTQRSYYDLAAGRDGALFASRLKIGDDDRFVADALDKEGNVLFSFGEPEKRGNIRPGFLNQVRLAANDRGEIVLAFQTLGIVRVFDGKGNRLRDMPLESRDMERERADNMRQFANLTTGEKVAYRHIIEAARCVGDMTYVLRKTESGLEIMTFGPDFMPAGVFRYDADKDYYGLDFEVAGDRANPVFDILEMSPENRVDILVPAPGSR